MPDNEYIELKLLSEQLDNYRLQRHDFLNHWQVIMGYLQLGKADRALDYMRKGLQGLEAEQIVGQISDPVVGATLLNYVIKLSSEGYKVEVKFTEPLKEQNYWEEFWEEEYGQALYGYTIECLDRLAELKIRPNQAKVQLEIDEAVKSFRLYTRILDGENVIREDLFMLGTNQRGKNNVL